MAGVAAVGGVSAQIALIAGLRWRILRNSLGTWKARAELIAHAALGALAGIIALGIGLAGGAAAYFIVQKGRLEMLALVFWGVFGFWQLFPLLLALTTPEFDFRNLLRFPLRFPTFLTLSVLYGVFDPVAVAAIFWLGCIGAGIGSARPELVPWAAALLVLFAMMNLLLGRLVFAWLERLLARRRTREAMLLIFILTMLVVQLSVPVVERMSSKAKVAMLALGNASNILPPGAAARALISVARGTTGAAAQHATLLVAYTALFGILLRRRVLAQYRGEDLGEAETIAAGPAEREIEPGWHVPGVREPVAAVLEKECRYVIRNGPMLMIMVVPLILILFIVLVPRDSPRAPAFLRGSTEMLFPMAVAYALLIMAPTVLNSFAFDGRGVQALLMAPVRFRDVLAGKNLAFGLMLGLESLAIWLILSLALAPPTMATSTATCGALLFSALIFLTCGNALSLYFPRRFDFGQFRQRQSGVSILIGLVVQIVVYGISASVFGITRWLEKPWWATAIFLALAAGAFEVYRFGRVECERVAGARRETLTAELCRD